MVCDKVLFMSIMMDMSCVILLDFRVTITQPSTTGRPCPNTMTEVKPCESSPCYKWIKSPWTCDLQVGSYFISVLSITLCGFMCLCWKIYVLLYLLFVYIMI